MANVKCRARARDGVLLAVCLLAVVACGGDDDQGTSASAPAVESSEPGASVGADGQVAASGDAPADGEYDPNAVLRVIGTNAPQNVDPVRGISRCDPPQLAPLYDQLVRVEPDGSFAPGLANRWSAPDPLTFEMSLQPGVRFQDGTPFDAAAVKAHIERAKTDPESTLVGTTEFIESVDVVDDHTIRLHLTEPRAGILPALFTDRLGMVPSPNAVETTGAAYGATDAVGAGPYRFSSLVPNENLTLEKWDGYWQPSTQLLGGIEFMGSATEFQAQRIVDGEVDYAAIKDVDLPIVEQAAETGQVEYQLTPSDQYAHIFINWTKPPYDDLRVRQALEHAVDRELLAESLTDGAGTPAWGPLTPTSWAHNPEVENLYPYDPAKATELLADAGYPDGITLKMAAIDDPYYQRMASAVQDMLAASGITVEYTPVTGAEIQNSLYIRKEHDAAVTAWLGNPDPGIGLEQRWSSTGANNPADTTGKGIDELLAEGSATIDQASRAKAYEQAELLIMQQALEIPLFFNGGLVAYDPSVKNVVRGYTTCGTGNFLSPPTYIEAD